MNRYKDTDGLKFCIQVPQRFKVRHICHIERTNYVICLFRMEEINHIYK